MKVKELLGEKWGHEYTVPEEKRGMFKGRSVSDLESELNHLKSTGPHHEGSPEFTKERELEFAIRAKHHWSSEQEEHWSEEDEEQWGVHHTGENSGKSLEQLHHELTGAKRAGNTTRIRQKEFAIRAKSGWGKVK